MNVEFKVNYILMKKMNKAMGKKLAFDISVGRKLIKIMRRNYE